MISVLKFMPVIALMLGLGAGCTLFPEPEPSQILDPQPDLPAPSDDGMQSWTLNVARPEADPMRDSTRVLVRTGQGQLQVHSSARWVAAAPDMLRRLLIRHMRDAERLEEISSGVPGSDRTLSLDLRRFDLAETGASSLQAQITLEARIHQSRSAELMARRVFEYQAPVGSVQPNAINDGFEAALAGLIPELAEWVVTAGSTGSDA